jgi:hypothetical protein
MNKLRKIYKGEETWDCLYDQQDEILKAGVNKKGVDEAKSFKEDKSVTGGQDGGSNPLTRPKNNIASISKQLNNVAINNPLTIDNDNIITEEDLHDLMGFEEADFEQFYEEMDIVDNVDNKSSKKRNHEEAFGIDEEELIGVKKAKLDN